MTPSWTRGPTPHRPPDCLTWRLGLAVYGCVTLAAVGAFVASQFIAPAIPPVIAWWGSA